MQGTEHCDVKVQREEVCMTACQRHTKRIDCAIRRGYCMVTAHALRKKKGMVPRRLMTLVMLNMDSVANQVC